MIVTNSCRCGKCNRLLSYDERVKITTSEFIRDKQCSGSCGRVIDTFNLCKTCYEKYKEYSLKFFN